SSDVCSSDLTLVTRQVGAALKLRDAGEPPAIEEAARELVLGAVAQVNGVSGVEQVRAVGRKHTVVVAQVELVVEAYDPHGLAEGVVQVESNPTARARPRHLQRVVVGIRVIGGDQEVRIAQQGTELVGDE